jgi:hypothetical protein
MPRYATNWVDYQLPSGQEFAVAVCGYSGKVRHMTIGQDPIRRMFVKFVDVEGEACQTAEHCLALSCPLNHTEAEHLAHMLDMREDEQADAESAQTWGTESTVDALVKFADKMNESIPEELKKGMRLEQQT